jgi:hypothetical protein
VLSILLGLDCVSGCLFSCFNLRREQLVFLFQFATRTNYVLVGGVVTSR